MAVHTVYVVVFVSFGWFFFFAFCLLAMWYFLTKKKARKEKKEEADVIHRDEHLKVKEDVEKGPRGEEAVALSIEKDVHFEEDRVKNAEELRGKNMHWKSGGIDLEKGASASASN